ncbi:hypothetical protein BC829DRAFT_444689 [Chytridium lagenaria]|nr:hypothetical protein BC829DRAFT_444689 [Chytridium lagenaria]
MAAVAEKAKESNSSPEAISTISFNPNISHDSQRNSMEVSGLVVSGPPIPGEASFGSGPVHPASHSSFTTGIIDQPGSTSTLNTTKLEAGDIRMLRKPPNRIELTLADIREFQEFRMSQAPPLLRTTSDQQQQKRRMGPAEQHIDPSSSSSKAAGSSFAFSSSSTSAVNMSSTNSSALPSSTASLVSREGSPAAFKIQTCPSPILPANLRPETSTSAMSSAISFLSYPSRQTSDMSYLSSSTTFMGLIVTPGPGSALSVGHEPLNSATPTSPFLRRSGRTTSRVNRLVRVGVEASFSGSSDVSAFVTPSVRTDAGAPPPRGGRRKEAPAAITPASNSRNTRSTSAALAAASSDADDGEGIASSSRNLRPRITRETGRIIAQTAALSSGVREPSGGTQITPNASLTLSSSSLSSHRADSFVTPQPRALSLASSEILGEGSAVVSTSTSAIHGTIYTSSHYPRSSAGGLEAEITMRVTRSHTRGATPAQINTAVTPGSASRRGRGRRGVAAVRVAAVASPTPSELNIPSPHPGTPGAHLNQTSSFAHVSHHGHAGSPTPVQDEISVVGESSVMISPRRGLSAPARPVRIASVLSEHRSVSGSGSPEGSNESEGVKGRVR